MKKIAKLSKINLEGNELESLTQDFNQILDFVQTISEVNTEDISAIQHIVSYAAHTNEDKPLASLPVEKIQQMAPKFEAGHFVVPKVIESNA